jgi:hypothetical protein
MENSELIKRLKAELARAVAQKRPPSSSDMVAVVLKVAARLDPPGVTQDTLARVTGLSISTTRKYVTTLWRDGKVVEGKPLLIPRLGGGKIPVPRLYWKSGEETGL